MILEMMLAAALSFQEAGPEASAQADRAPRHWTSVSWAKMPMPQPPANAKGTMQAEVSCVAGERNRVVSCRLDRQIPANGDFGRRVLRSMGAARTRGEDIRPGDTMTLTIWLCMDTGRNDVCQRLPWPETQ